ncbi:hypothetical protein TSAR_014819 [Trichomalopsis sarcophagae]|uniref:Uncharacterized protein n=1 Tax=Trichomalopsis sarcophagae TaxID=543379 RepID=A0A232ELG2_9HYME|nr:hypothetical protein TSAR_014819 [Trichomalopsis sarcophagae]
MIQSSALVKAVRIDVIFIRSKENFEIEHPDECFFVKRSNIVQQFIVTIEGQPRYVCSVVERRDVLLEQDSDH